MASIMGENRPVSSNIVVKLQDKKKILVFEIWERRRDKHVLYEGSKIRMALHYSTATIEVRIQWKNIFIINRGKQFLS